MACKNDSLFSMLDDEIFMDNDECNETVSISVNEVKDHVLIAIACEENGRLQIKEDALERILSDPAIGDKEISLISIAGQYRTGKSFLLNFFIRYLRNEGWKNTDWFGDKTKKVTDGIDWERGTEAHTKGILMWPEVFIVEDDEKEVAVLLTDTQGLFDTDTGSDTNARILSVSTLLSSHQILNIMNRIEERDLEHLQLCSNYAIAATGNTERENSNKPFEALTFLVRDWQYEFEHKYGDGGMSYLDGILKQTSKCSEVDNVKKTIHEVFKNVRCFLMPHPGDDVLQKNRMSVANEDLDEDFYIFVKEFVAKVLHPEQLVTKTFADKTLTADEILELMLSVADCFKRGNIPEIKSLYEEAAHSFNQKIMKMSVNKYKMEVEKNIDSKAVSDFQLEEYHRKAMKEAKQVFQLNSTFGNDDIKIQYLRQTEELCNSHFTEIETQNDRLLREQNRTISSLREKCFLRYQSKIDQILKQEKAMTQHQIQACHNKQRREAENWLEKEVKSLNTGRVKAWTVDLENKIENKYQEFKWANQRRLDTEQRERQLADLKRKETERWGREESGRSYSRKPPGFAQNIALSNEFLLSIREKHTQLNDHRKRDIGEWQPEVRDRRSRGGAVVSPEWDGLVDELRLKFLNNKHLNDHD